jgi:quinol monooxygenase YgiN
MLIIHVHVHVVPEQVEAFREATIENARSSIKEPGIARFDFLQDSADPSHFVLIEVYRNAQARPEHRETAHYRVWRDRVAGMMAEPRTSVEYANVFPDDSSW